MRLLPERISGRKIQGRHAHLETDRSGSTDAMSKFALAVTLKEQIGKLHRQSLEFDNQIRSLVLEKLNTTRAAGTVLQEARETLNPKEFHAMLQELGLNSQVVHSYLSFARKHKQKPFSDFGVAVRSAFEQTLRTTGLLPMPSGHGAQNSHGPPAFFSWASHAVMQFKTAFAKYLVAKPLDNWSVHEAEQFAYSLRPILKVHQTITQWIKQRQ